MRYFKKGNSYAKLYNQILIDKFINNGYIEIPKEEYPKDNSERINELKANLDATDYKSIKHSEGAMSDEEFEPIRVQRQAWRDEINELEK